MRELRDDQRGLTLVFVRTKRGADRLVKRLGAHDVEALAMHGNKSQSQREKALARFESGRVDTLVATDVAARGLDIDDITHVINFDAPADHEGYIHRVGRTGRAGRRGVGVTFVEHEQAMGRPPHRPGSVPGEGVRKIGPFPSGGPRRPPYCSSEVLPGKADSARARPVILRIPLLNTEGNQTT